MVFSNIDAADSSYASNRVSTTKYRRGTFLFHATWLQFHQASNIFFLATAILNTFPMMHVYSNFTMYSPIAIVVTVALYREYLEDRARRRQDRGDNEAPVTVIRGGERQTVQSAHIVPGDIVQVRRDAEVPADLVLLRSSNEGGTAYVMTSNIDGETNLKLRRALDVDEDDLADLVVGVVCERPHPVLTYFSGSLVQLPRSQVLAHPGESVRDAACYLLQSYVGESLDDAVHLEMDRVANIELVDSPDTSDSHDDDLRAAVRPVTLTNVLLRGSRLRNTAEAWGVCVYAGHETKAFLNSTSTPNKQSTQMHLLNSAVTVLFFVSVVVCVALAVPSRIWEETLTSHWYLSSLFGDDAVESFLGSFASYFVLLSTMIPVSLFVTVDLARFMQARMIERDNHFKLRGADDDRRMVVRNSCLNEELGYVQHLFSDKTGTLTENEMLFDTLWTPQGAWRTERGFDRGGDGHSVPLTIGGPMHLELLVEENQSEARPTAALSVLGLCHSVIPDYSGVVFEDDEEQDLASRPSTAARSRPQTAPQVTPELARCSALVIVSPGSADSVPVVELRNRPDYMAESPDEEALVGAASANDLVLLAASESSYTCLTSDVVCALRYGAHITPVRVGRVGALAYVVRFDVACTVPFTSDRKRHSTVLRCPLGVELIDDTDCHENGDLLNTAAASPVYRVLMKGADTVVLPRCTSSAAEERVSAADALDRFSELGLRTLVLGERELSEQEAIGFLEQYRAAECIVNPEEKLAALGRAAELIESRSFTLSGVTAIEDRLQDGVPETIAFLRRAGVKVWMLTGDKLQTAVNIAKSACLFSVGQDILYLTERQITGMASVRPAVSHLSGCVARALERVASGDPRAMPPALVVDGTALAYIFKHERTTRRFVSVSLGCSAVVLCRATPLQKALLVASVRDRGKIVAAVGDGANDVGMIQVASVGIGIAGREGLQASRQADFSVSRFRHLRRLLAYHGRYNYIRLCSIIQFSFYKNLASAVISILFSFYNGFSATTPFDSFSTMCYNIFFTFLPILSVGVFDKDLPGFTCNEVPEAYRPLQKRRVMRPATLLRWVLLALLHGSTVYYLSYILFGKDSLRGDGLSGGLSMMQMAMVSSLLFIVTIQSCITAREWNVMFVTTLIISMLAYIVLSWGASFFPGVVDWSSVGVFDEMMRESFIGFWIGVSLTVVCAMCPVLLIKAIGSHVKPSTAQVVHELTRCRKRLLGKGKSDSLEARWRAMRAKWVMESV